MSELDEKFQNDEEEDEVEAHKKRMNDEPASEDDSDDDVEAHIFQP